MSQTIWEIRDNISLRQDFSIEEMKYMPIYKFDKNLLPLCEEGLLKTESFSIKNRLIIIMLANNYVPASTEAQKMIDEYMAQRNSGTRAGRGVISLP